MEVKINHNCIDITATSLGGGGSLSKKSMCFAINQYVKKPRGTTNLRIIIIIVLKYGLSLLRFFFVVTKSD